MEYVINQVYQRTFNVVVDGFDESEKMIAKNEYLVDLRNKYLELGPITERYFERILMLEYNEWKQLPLDMRKQMLLKDNALEEIVNLTGQGQKWAEERVDNNSLISVEIVEKYINRIEELLPLVQEYNRELAGWYVSEGITDLIYASGQTNNKSFRIGRYK